MVAKSDRVFAKRKTHLRNAALARGARLNDFDELEPGEYVVHVDYGVGRFVGSSEILVNGKRSEVFTIEYADGAKLHVPPMRLCGDNGAMIGAQAYYEYRAGHTAGSDLNAWATMPL